MTAKPLIASLLVLMGAAGWAQTPGPVAGLHPDRRPDGAPQLSRFSMTEAQIAQALRGVEGVPPGNLRSIVSAGAWWVPLRQPGMTAPYDPRGMHAGAAPAELGAPAATAAAAAR